MDDAQCKYATTEKELLAIVFAFEKFRSYIVGSKVIVHTDHAALRHIFAKKIQSQDFSDGSFCFKSLIEVVDKKGVENGVADHLSRMRVEDMIPINDSMPEEQLMAIMILKESFDEKARLEEVKALRDENLPWYADIVNFMVSGEVPSSFDAYKRKKFFKDARHYYWDEPYLYKRGPDSIYRRCIAEEDVQGVLEHCHGMQQTTLPSVIRAKGKEGSPRGRDATKPNSTCTREDQTAFTGATKVLQSGLWWPTLFKDAADYIAKCDPCQRKGGITKTDEMPLNPILPVQERTRQHLQEDAADYIAKCDPCQRKGGITKTDEMPLNPILEVEIFDVWGIDFMGPFKPSSNGHNYILVAVDYVSKWIEAIPCPTCDAKMEAPISSTRCLKIDEKPRSKTQGRHPYHPQTSGQVEVSNRQIKAILEKTVSFTRKDWAARLDEALWAYRTAYKTPIGRSPFNLLYGKDCHLPVEVEYKALWAVKMLNFDIKAAQERRVMNLFELEEIRMNAYENSRIYKMRTKAAHDKLIRLKDFKVGDSVLLFNSKLRLFPGKLRSKWSGPFKITKFYPMDPSLCSTKRGRNSQ
ncbi:unnamed protein product [Microthlaspi erraticum]|uniref:Reverse transcriptase RNase H-like domain-containing protein n=1 Tax=Microthlaspi erraticum TaxID=1685480 RepID=A0A6D2K098_9BRAS|nr:unnamed protein product [Microthlaspi erraticum]